MKFDWQMCGRFQLTTNYIQCIKSGYIEKFNTIIANTNRIQLMDFVDDRVAQPIECFHKSL